MEGMEVSDYIRMMRELSRTKENEVILECLEYYNLGGTRELTKEQCIRFLMMRNDQGGK